MVLYQINGICPIFRTVGVVSNRTLCVTLVRLIHLSPPPDVLVNHILAPAVRQVYRKRCPTVS